MQKLTRLDRSCIYAYQEQLRQIKNQLHHLKQTIYDACSNDELPFVRHHIDEMIQNVQEQADICEQLL